MLWGPTEAGPAWDYYGLSTSIYDGKLFSYGYGGVLLAYNITTGEKLWDWTSGSVGLETFYENVPLVLGCIADGKLYFYSSEHSPSQPLRRDANIWCVDANTGEELWKIQCWASNLALADGYIVTVDHFDNQIYCYGKGPSETTVTAPDTGIPLGSSVMIRGTVTDESPGTKSTLLTARFPNGVPAISDEDQSAWMEYLYQQQPMPADATGVKVTLDAIDPNGSFISIGTATSDMSGFYSYKWTPEHEGKYTIIATFEGSKSYYSSYAETAIGVDPAPSPAEPIEPEEPTEAPLITTEVAIIVAVAVAVVIGVVAYWVLRKRK